MGLWPGRRRRSQEEPFVTWHRRHRDELDDLADPVAELLAKRVDGYTVAGALDADRCAAAMTGIDIVRANGIPYELGWMAPLPLNACTSDRGAYLEGAASARAWMGDVLGFDATVWFDGLFRSLSGGRPAEVFREGGRPYLPATFRVMEPRLGGLKAHTGNEFLVNNRTGAMGALDAELDIWDGLSFFLVLQTSEAGGALRLFDLRYEDTPSEMFGFGSNDRDDAPFDAIRHWDVPLVAGDLVVFRGGDIWHKVTDIDGGRPRVTLGGFASPTKVGGGLRYWS